MNFQHEQSDIPSAIVTILADAASLYQDGRMTDVIDACQKVLELDKGNFDALHLLGKAGNHIGQWSLAEFFLRQALSVRPDTTEIHSDLGLALISLGRINNPRNNFTSNPDLGLAIESLRLLEQSLECFLKSLEFSPDSAEANSNVATALYEMGRMSEAMRYCQVAISLQHDFAPAHARKGMIHYYWDDLRLALESYTRAHLIAPENIEVLNLLATHKIALGKPDEGLPYVHQVLSQHPGHELATALMQEIINAMQDNAPAKEAFFNAGLIDKAEEIARDELLKNNSVENHNFLLKCYLASNKYSALDYFQESRKWSVMHAHEELLPHADEFNNNRNPDRRLRVGIVGDYFVGVIGAYTLLPFFRLYDRKKLAVYCYNFGPGEEEIRPIVDNYRDISQLSDQEFFKLVRNDSIDIMLDINGRIRTPNYFGALLMQPAPIQVNWYNLPCTVGVKAYNYAITDEFSVRDGEEEFFVEKIFRMPTGTITAWDMGVPPVVPRPPFEVNGYVTFGCFGDFFKVNEEVLATWADLLGRVPYSRLYLKSNNLRLVSERERVTEFFRQRGIDPERLILEGVSQYNRMKKCYELVDIGLDTFPYSSGSTTINALWQGVPVVTVEGNDYRGRSTGSILAGCGMKRLIASNVAEYVDMTVALAADSAQLIYFRANLARILMASPQWQTGRFARNFELRLRTIWKDWLRQSK